jgi:hypothetical protein
MMYDSRKTARLVHRDNGVEMNLLDVCYIKVYCNSVL